MRSQRWSLVLLVEILVSCVASGETNILDLIKARQLPESRLPEYALSLNESEVRQLANEAFEKGWDSYAVSVLILGPYYESNGRDFTVEKKLAILNDSKMHPAFRAHMASAGLKDRSLDMDGFLRYVDGLLFLFEDQTVEYFYRQGIPEFIREALQRRLKAVQTQPDDVLKSRTVASISSTGIRMMNDLVACLEMKVKSLERTVPKSTEKEVYSPSSFAAASLSRYIAWFLDEPLFQTGQGQQCADAARKAQRALVSILEDGGYDSTASRKVLQCAEDSKLYEVLSEEALAKIKTDSRFSNDEDQRLLDALSRRVKSGA